MQLGAFFVSLAVKDIAASAAFYENLGFSRFGGDITQNWVILKNGETVIGQRFDQRLDFALGADIDAAGGFVQNEQPRFGG